MNPARFLPAAGAVLLAMLVSSGCSTSATSEVVIYTSQDQVFSEPILRDFEAESGVRVRAVYDSEAVKTVGLVNRLLAEQHQPQCDVFWNNEELRTRQLAERGLFGQSNGWFAMGHRTRRLVVNTNLVSRGQEPHTFLELTNSVWRGKIVMAYPFFGTTATHLHALRQHYGVEGWERWCRALMQNQVRLVDGNSVVVQWVSRGEAAVGMTDSDDIAAGQRQGWPIAAMPPGPETLRIPNTVAILREAPHAASARRLAEYLRRPEVLQKLVQAQALESVESVALDSSGYLSPDWAALLRDLPSTTEWMERVFLR